MSEANIRERTRKLVAEHLVTDAEEIQDTDSFLDDLNCDSLDILELVMAAEEEFGIEIDDEVAGTWVTFNDAVAFLEKEVK